MAQRWNSGPQRKRVQLKQDPAKVRFQYIKELEKEKPDLWKFLSERGELKAGGISAEDVRKLIDGSTKEVLQFYQQRDVNIFRQMAGELLLNGADRGFTRDELITLINSVQNKNQVGLLTDLMFGEQKSARANARNVIDSAPKYEGLLGQGQFDVDAADEKKRIAALQREEAIRSAPNAGVYSSNVSDETMAEVEAAKKRLKERKASPKKLLSSQDMSDLQIVRRYDPDFLEATRYSTTDIYKDFDKRISNYQKELRAIANKMRFSSEVERDNWIKSRSLSRGHLVPKVAQPHLHNADTNISVQGLITNRDQWATMTLADFVNNMDQVSESGPRMQGSAVKLMGDTLNNLSAKGHNVSRLQAAANDLVSNYPRYKMPIDPSSPAWGVNMFTEAGNFRSYQEMLEDPSTGVKTKADYERYRRLFITMMQGNPEWDLDGYLSSRSNLPKEFIEGIEVDADAGRKIPIYEVAGGNSEVASELFGTKSKAAAAFRGHGSKLGAALTLLAASGAVFAQDEDPMDESTWSEATMNKVLSVMDQLGQYEQQGMGAIQQAVPGAAQVGQAYNQGIDFLNFGKGQQTSAPVVYDESGQPTGGGSWNAQKGLGDYIDIARQFLLPVEDAAVMVGVMQPEFSRVSRDEDFISP